MGVLLYQSDPLRIADETGGPDSRRGTGVGKWPVDTDISRGNRVPEGESR